MSLLFTTCVRDRQVRKHQRVCTVTNAAAVESLEDRTLLSGMVGLGDLDGMGFDTYATDVSADGSVIVGYSETPNSPEDDAFRWTEDLGLQPLVRTPPSGFGSKAFGISDDGSVIVGYADQSQLAGGQVAFYWTEQGRLVGAFSPGATNASAVSSDGTVIVGHGLISVTGEFRSEAFRWTRETGPVGLDDLPGGSFSSSANDVSADGSVVVGVATTSAGDQAFRWTQSAGIQPLEEGDSPSGFDESQALAVSSDGTVIVGVGWNSDGIMAFRWTEESGFERLGDLAGGAVESVAYDVSADGSVIVGYSRSSQGIEAFRWTDDLGMVGLGDLEGGGFMSRARAVSADGSVIVGSSESADGVEAFRWTAPSLPPLNAGRLAFHSYTAYGKVPGEPYWPLDSTISIVDLATYTHNERAEQEIANNVRHALNPQFSPDGSQLVFMGLKKDSGYSHLPTGEDRDGNPTNDWGRFLDIFLYDFRNNKVIPLSEQFLDKNGGTVDEDPSFNHDGTKIVFKRSSGVIREDSNLSVLTLSETLADLPQETVFTVPPGFEVSGPRYSPDGNSICVLGGP